MIKHQKEDFDCICLSLILIGSVFKKDENYYPQAFFEEYKCYIKEKKQQKYILQEILKYLLMNTKKSFLIKNRLIDKPL